MHVIQNYKAKQFGENYRINDMDRVLKKMINTHSTSRHCLV